MRLAGLLPFALIAVTARAEPVRRDLPGEVMPDRAWDVLHLHLDVRVDVDHGTVEGTARHTIAPLGRPDGWLRLHQRALDVRAVRVDGQVVDGWRLGEETLDVPLPAGKGERTVEVDYAARPQTGLHFRGRQGSGEAREVWSQGEAMDNRYWYPAWDYPNDRFTFSIDLTAPSDLVALSVGEQRAKAEAGAGWTRWSYALDRSIPNYLVTIVVGDYTVHEDPGPVPLSYVVPRGTPREQAVRTFGDAKAQLEWFGELLGQPYPYPTYRQVAVQRFLYGAMENPTLVTFDASYAVVEATPRDLGTESVVAHELAHQWFGDLLTTYGWRELWLNEGFASFYAARWLEHRYGPEQAAVDARDSYAGARRDRAPLAPRAWSKLDGRDHGAVYTRGSSVLRMLRVHLGDEVFDAAIRRWIAENTDAFVESEQLRRTFEEVSGEHLGWLWDQYVYDGGVPAIAASHAWRDGTLTVDLSQTTDGAAFTIPLEVEIGLPSEVVTRKLWVEGGRTKVVIETDEPPLWVAVDPRCGVLAAWDHDQEPKEWLAQLEHSPSPCARLAAIEALGELPATPDAVAALKRVATDGAHVAEYRVQAVRALGELGLDAVPGLLDLLDEPEVQVRRDAAAALGRIGSADAIAGLQAAQRADADPEVRANALRAIAATLPKRALPLAREVLKRKDAHPRRFEHVAAADVLGDHGEIGDLGLLLDRTGAREPRQARHAAAKAAVRLLQRLEDADQRKRRGDLSRTLEPFLDDPDLRARWLGADLLGKVGDEAAEARLRTVAAEWTVPDLRDHALDAANRIRNRGAEPERTPAEDEADEERMDERMDELEKRLQRLEEWR